MLPTFDGLLRAGLQFVLRRALGPLLKSDVRE